MIGWSVVIDPGSSSVLVVSLMRPSFLVTLHSSQ